MVARLCASCQRIEHMNFNRIWPCSGCGNLAASCSEKGLDPLYLVKLLKLITLLLATVPADGRHVHHAVAELDEGTPVTTVAINISVNVDG